jgi:hypothetical protein
MLGVLALAMKHGPAWATMPPERRSTSARQPNASCAAISGQPALALH